MVWKCGPTQNNYLNLPYHIGQRGGCLGQRGATRQQWGTVGDSILSSDNPQHFPICCMVVAWIKNTHDVLEVWPQPDIVQQFFFPKFPKLLLYSTFVHVYAYILFKPSFGFGSQLLFQNLKPLPTTIDPIHKLVLYLGATEF